MRRVRWRLVLGSIAAVALVLPATVPMVARSGPGPQSIPVVATSVSGGGASFMRVEVNRHGNLFFESPRDVWMTNFAEGYALCRNGEAYAYDLPTEEGGVAGFGPVAVTQPTPGVFPVTIVRKTLDGTIRLSQTWAVPDAVEKDVTVTMTVRNIGTTPISDVALMRSAEGHTQFGYSFFNAATTADSVFQWWDRGDGTAVGLVMTARTVGKPHEAGMSSDIDNALFCGGYGSMEPSDAEGLPQIVYSLPTLPPGAEVTMAFVYHRL